MATSGRDVDIAVASLQNDVVDYLLKPFTESRLSEALLDKSPIHLPYLSTHPQHKALVPLIGLETGSVATGKRIMPSKAVPFPIDEWPSVVIRGLEILNKHNWFPAMTLIVGTGMPSRSVAVPLSQRRCSSERPAAAG